ncbi:MULTISPECIES: hypothetical protein [unclassified Leifsonia]|uniref:hypothetical protein n=1 Tax=unclassified Leifsonia TaxID=2663824 RepID=UPI000A4059E8|nr:MULTISPECIES: hypothetical protein [unclassified Leifsonia]
MALDAGEIAEVRALAREEAAKLVGIKLDAAGKTGAQTYNDAILAKIAAGGGGR